VSNARLTLVALALTGCAPTTLERAANDVANPQALAAPLPEASQVLAEGFDPAAAYDIMPAAGSGGHRHHGSAPVDPHAKHRKPSRAPQPSLPDAGEDHGGMESPH
jgi:hypothetical protein